MNTCLRPQVRSGLPGAGAGDSIMSQVYHIGDLHFDHKNITNFHCTTEKKYRLGDTYLENMEIIIDRWNSLVNKRDLVRVRSNKTYSV